MNLSQISNGSELVSHGNINGRKKTLEILDSGLKAPNPYENTKRIVRIEDGNLIIGDPVFAEPPGQEPVVFDLSTIQNIYIVGGGKSVQPTAKALEEVLGNRITDGHICIKKGDPVEVERIGVTLAGHPIPDEDSVAGARKILAIEKNAKEGDIVFWCYSGGGTSLLALPAPGITLAEVQDVCQKLYFGKGASMPETNAVRQLLTILRGKHPKYVRGAALVRILSDEHLPEKEFFHSSPLPGHEGGYARARRVLEKYDLWNRVTGSIRDFIDRGDPQFLLPNEAELNQRPYYRYRVMGPEYMLTAARSKAANMGLTSEIIASGLNDIEARPAAEVLAKIALESEVKGTLFKPPCSFICGGEVVVATGEKEGIGGRNQEFVLWAAKLIAGSRNIVIASADSDGTDGATDVAGGIVDGYTMERIAGAGINLDRELANHNSSEVLKMLDDRIYINYNGANARDLRVFYIGDA